MPKVLFRPRRYATDDQERRMTMTRSWKRCIVGGIALSAAVIFASTMAATSVRADHARPLDRALAGAIIGGLIGSAIGHGSDTSVTIGVGATLGSIYFDRHASHYHPARVHHRPAYRHHQWRHHRVHRQAWHVPPRWHHRHHHHGWKRPRAHPPVVLQPRPRDAIRHRAPHRHHAKKDCRVLEGGARPVIACRGAGGNWRILH